MPSSRRPFDPQLVLEIQGARGNNLKNVTVQFPVGVMTCVTGVSGSGKSTLVNDTLYRLVAQSINKTGEDSAPFDARKGLEHFDNVIDISARRHRPHAALESRPPTAACSRRSASCSRPCPNRARAATSRAASAST